MTKPTDTSAPIESKWEIVSSEHKSLAHRGVNPPMVRVTGWGACVLNAAARHLLSEVAIARALSNRFPSGLIAAKDSVTGNPVVLPTNDPNVQTVAINWGSHGSSPAFNLSGPLAGWNVPVRLGRRQTLRVPVAIANDPTTKLPGLMLQWNVAIKHDVVKRGAKGPHAHTQAAASRMAGDVPQS